MKNHALYLTDNYDLAYEFATKDGDGGLVSGEVATLYTCELNIKKAYETHSEAEYDSDFIDISFNREKWLEKGYNAIIIHPTEASKTTYYIMLNPEEDVKIIDKEIIDSGDLLMEAELRSVNTGTNMFLKVAKEKNFIVPNWNQINNSSIPNRNGDYSNYFNIIKNNEIVSVRISDHDITETSSKNRNNFQISIICSSKKIEQQYIEKYINLADKIISKIPDFKHDADKKLSDTFIKEYIELSSQNNHNNIWFYNLLLKYNISTIYRTFIWFKNMLKEKCEKYVNNNKIYESKYHSTGIYYYNNKNTINLNPQIDY